MSALDKYKFRLQDSISRIKTADKHYFSHSVDRKAFFAQAQKTLDRLDTDIARVKHSAHILFPKLKDGELGANAGIALSTLFQEWRQDPPSTAAIFTVAMSALKIPSDHPYVTTAFLTAIAADVGKDNPYHSHHHSREVACAMVRLLYIHQQLERPLSTAFLLKGMTAAGGHDLLHDGQGNLGIQYKLEDTAAQALVPFLNAGNVTRDDAADIHAMIRTTDVGMINGRISPSMAVKKFSAGQPLENAPSGIARVFESPQLLMMAGLLSDADLTPSAATDPAFSRLMTSYVSAENPAIPDTPATTGKFIEFVLGGQFTTKAGRAAGQASLLNIQAELQKTSGPKPETP